MRERVPEDSRWFWFVLDADRRFVTGVFLAMVFLSVVLVGVLHPTPASKLLTRGDPSETLFNALVAATITGVTLVLTLSQLVLSQELGAVGDQRERMAGALQFRDDMGDVIEPDVPPAEPSAVLRELVSATSDRAREFGSGAASGDLPDEAVERIERFVDSVTGNADAVTDQLDGAQFGEFDVVWAALNYNYSWKLHAGQRIRTNWGDQLGDDATAALDDLLEALELFGPAREHFKTLYFQWELSDLSRTLLYAAIPALTAAIVGLLLVDPRDLTGMTLGVNHALFVVALLTTISIAPFAVLLAYILRIVTVTKRTLSIGPFILRETDRESTASESDD